MMYVPFPSEQAIEDYVYHSLTEQCWDPILHCEFTGAVFRQLDVPGYGIVDLLTVEEVDSSIDFIVFELKNEPLKEAHVTQLCRYLTGVRRTLQRYKRRLFKDAPMRLRGVLAGPFDPHKNDLVFLAQEIPTVQMYSLSLSFAAGFCSEPAGSNWRSTRETRKLDRSVLLEGQMMLQQQRESRGF